MNTVLYLLVGGAAGVLSGLFGIGGGIVIVVVLVSYFFYIIAGALLAGSAAWFWGVVRDDGAGV